MLTLSPMGLLKWLKIIRWSSKSEKESRKAMLKTRGKEGKSDYGYLLLNMYPVNNLRWQMSVWRQSNVSSNVSSNVELTLDWLKTDICQRRLLTGYVREYLENRVITLCYFHVQQECTAEVFDTELLPSSAQSSLSAACSLLPPAHPMSSTPGESEHTSDDLSVVVSIDLIESLQFLRKIMMYTLITCFYCTVITLSLYMQ